jgi:hypothetical protein
MAVTVSSQADEKPWYRHVWPWLLMIPPGAAVIGGFLTAYIAGPPPALVVDDYGEIAMATQQRLARDRRARELGLTARVSFAAGEPGERAPGITVALEHTGRYVLPPQLVLKLVHPTRAELDAAATLTGHKGEYHGIVQRPAGRTYVHLADAESSWRLVGQLPAGGASLKLLPRGSGPAPRNDP